MSTVRRTAATAFAGVILALAGEAQADPRPDPSPWFGGDKALHFTVSAAIAGGGYALSTLGTRSIAWRIACGGAAGVAAGAGKELVDLAGYGDPSWRDFAWDVAGTAVGVGIAVTIDVATRGPVVKSTRAALLF